MDESAACAPPMPALAQAGSRTEAETEAESEAERETAALIARLRAELCAAARPEEVSGHPAEAAATE